MDKFCNFLEMFPSPVWGLKKYLTTQPLDLSNYMFEFFEWNKSKDIAKRAGINLKKLKKDVENGNFNYNEIKKLEKSMTENEIGYFLNIIGKYDPSEIPAWATLSFSRLVKNEWLVHFTDNANDIEKQGFKRGVDDVRRIALTRYLNDREKDFGGYNFAFIAGSKESIMSAKKYRYGKDVIMFQSSGVLAYHYGDEEEQVIFYGPSVDVNKIVKLIKIDDDEWEVRTKSKSSMNIKNREAAYFGSFSDCVQWVKKNYNQYKNQI